MHIQQRDIFLALVLGFFLQSCAQAPGQQLDLLIPSATSDAGSETPSPTSVPLTIDALMKSCPTRQQIDFIDSQTEIIFLGDPTERVLTCFSADGSKDLTLLEKNVYNTFLVMQEISFDLPLPWTELDLFDWFSQAVNGVVFDPDAQFSRCCDESRRILVQTQFLLAAQTELWLDSYHGGAGVNSLLGMLIHEARHAEGYPHLCTTVAGNDIDLEEMGAWAVEYYLDLWISDHVHSDFFTEYYRELAHANAHLILDRRFCEGEPPFP